MLRKLKLTSLHPDTQVTSTLVTSGWNLKSQISSLKSLSNLKSQISSLKSLSNPIHPDETGLAYKHVGMLYYHVCMHT